MKWVFTEDTTIDGVEFKKGDTIEGTKGQIGKDAQGNPIEGIWVKWHTGKKLKVPISVLSQVDQSSAPANKPGKSLLQAMADTPTWTKVLPAVGVAAGLSIAHYRGGSYGKYAAWGFGLGLFTAIPFMLKTWDNIRGGTAGVMDGLKNQMAQTENNAAQKSMRTAASQSNPAEQEKFVQDLTNAAAQLMKSSTGIDANQTQVRTLSQIFSQVHLNKEQFEILLEYITTSTSINIRNLDETENEETLKPMYDQLDQLQKKIVADALLTGVIKQLSE